MLHECDKLKKVNERLTDEVVDLQAISIRDNLLLFQFNDNARYWVTYERKLHWPDMEILWKKIKNQKCIKHENRSRSSHGKTRPLVAKVHDPPDKLTVKQAPYGKSRDTEYRVSDRSIPKAIQERRRRLVPNYSRLVEMEWVPSYLTTGLWSKGDETARTPKI